MNKNDIKIIIGVLVIAGLFYLFNQYRISRMDTDNLFVEIKVDGERYQLIKLGEEKEVKIKKEGRYNIIKVHDNGVEMVEANCPDHICTKTGFISKVGSTIVCLPHKIYIEIIGNAKEELDAISE